MTNPKVNGTRRLNADFTSGLLQSTSKALCMFLGKCVFTADRPDAIIY